MTHDVLSVLQHLLPVSLGRVGRLADPLLLPVDAPVALPPDAAPLALLCLLGRLQHLAAPQVEEVVGVRVELDTVLAILITCW